MTYKEYRNAVVLQVIRQTGWTYLEAENVVGECCEAQAEGLSVSEAANELIAAWEESRA